MEKVRILKNVDKVIFSIVNPHIKIKSRKRKKRSLLFDTADILSHVLDHAQATVYGIVARFDMLYRWENNYVFAAPRGEGFKLLQWLRDNARELGLEVWGNDIVNEYRHRSFLHLYLDRALVGTIHVVEYPILIHVSPDFAETVIKKCVDIIRQRTQPSKVKFGSMFVHIETTYASAQLEYGDKISDWTIIYLDYCDYGITITTPTFTDDPNIENMARKHGLDTIHDDDDNIWIEKTFTETIPKPEQIATTVETILKTLRQAHQ